MSEPVLITAPAYAKMLLHALKHPTQPLSGLLVGKLVAASAVTSGDSAVSSSDSAATVLFVSDAVPLTHSQVATLPHPIVEAGARMVHSQACSQGCGVVGCYFANERFDDGELCELNRRMAAHVAKLFSSGSGGADDGPDDEDDASSSSAVASPSASSSAAAAAARAKSGRSSSADAAASRHVTFLLDNAALCDEAGPAAALAVRAFFGLGGGGGGFGSSRVAGVAGERVLFSAWNHDTGAPERPLPFAGAVAARVAALVGREQRQPPLWDFEEHLEGCNDRDFYNGWIA
jgi:hypothetical protein